MKFSFSYIKNIKLVTSASPGEHGTMVVLCRTAEEMTMWVQSEESRAEGGRWTEGLECRPGQGRL